MLKREMRWGGLRGHKGCVIERRRKGKKLLMILGRVWCVEKIVERRNKWNHGNEKLWHGDGIQYKFLHNFALPHNYPLFDSNWVFLYIYYFFLHCYLFVCVMLWRRMAVLWNNVINSIFYFTPQQPRIITTEQPNTPNTVTLEKSV